MMDSDVIQKLLEKKKRLDQTDEAHCISFVCEQLYGGYWDAHYAACDLHLITFGVCDSFGKCFLHSEHARPSDCSKKSLKSPIIRALRIMRKYAHYHDALNFGEYVKGSYSKA
jgi:hypothetical protein